MSGIVEVFATVAQAADALAQERLLRMFNQRRIARIGQHLGDGLGQSQPAIPLAQQRQPAVAGHVAAGKAGGDRALFYGWKLKQFRVTNCARRNGGFVFISPQ